MGSRDEFFLRFFTPFIVLFWRGNNNFEVAVMSVDFEREIYSGWRVVAALVSSIDRKLS